MSAKIIEQVKEVLKIEAEAVLGLLDRVGPEFERAVKIILKSRGRVILTGMGKSGLVARKISATLNSTGTPSLFLHPAEAIHGDLGMDGCRGYPGNEGGRFEGAASGGDGGHS